MLLWSCTLSCCCVATSTIVYRSEMLFDDMLCCAVLCR